MTQTHLEWKYRSLYTQQYTYIQQYTMYNMKTQQITKIEEGEIPARFIKFGETFQLVAYHLGKQFTREEALKIKKQYNMKPYSQRCVYGYEGVVPKSIFLNGFEMVN